jgi:hypothetical protein
MRSGTVAAGLLLMTAGCGYISSPAPPLANIPTQIPDLAAIQRGANIIVHFTVPTFTTENHPIQKSLNLDLRIGVASRPFRVDDWARDAKQMPTGAVAGGIANYKIPTKDWVGKLVAIGARATGSNGKPGNWSSVELVQVVPPPETPSQPEVTDVPIGEHVTWSGAGDQFRVMRRATDEKDFFIAHTGTEHEWTDTAIDYSKTYIYMMQAMVAAGDGRWAESDLSPERTVTPVDKFPPAVPTGLHGDRSGTSVTLVWDSNSDADLAGYRVYRQVGDGPWQKLADVNSVPTYTDTTAEHGKTYHYAVSAFDKAIKPNESERSAPVEIQVP